ncbi:MAG: type VI secretion system baseplate subunit TssK [Syntrophales bacterium]|jgi:type VI secretion system protein ImpJ
MTDPIRPVFWYQGLFLQPQHFQWQDLHDQYRLYPLQNYLQPYFWGLGQLRIQEESLKNQMFEILEMQILFRDGTWIVFPGTGDVQPRSFKGIWTEMDKPFNIYLGLRKWNPRGGNVTVLKNPDDLSGVATRFASPADPEETKDLHQSGPSAQIKFLSHVLRIFWENEVEGAGDYELLPLAQLEFNGNEIILSPTYIPPVLSIASSDILAGLVKGIREEVTLRCSVLEEYKHPKLNQTAQAAQDSDESNYMVFLLALRALIRYVPLLHHHTEGSPHVHPWTVYGILRSLVGELSAFTDRIDALGRLKDGTELLPPYRHDQLGSCFQEVKILIDELLNGIMIGAENVIHLIREGDYFRALIPVETFDNRNLFYLMLRSSVNKEEWEQTIQHMVKISSAERLPILIKRALPGMPLDQITILPPGLPRRPDSTYFRLERSNTEWSEIQKQQNICLYWSHAPEDTLAEIIIIKK